MWKFVAAGIGIFAVVLLGFSLIDGGDGEVRASAVFVTSPDEVARYARATEPKRWEFPRDHGAHLAYQTEWWYFTGNLTTEQGRHFGYQFTVFRRAITPEAVESPSEWRTNQIFLAHFTLSDIESGRFYHDERYSRGAAGLAFAVPNELAPDEAFRVALEDWTVFDPVGDGRQFRITAASPNGFAVDLTLTPQKPPALQGDRGLSAKSSEPGNASHYYSLTRIATVGTIQAGDQSHDVSGLTWMDQEFSTSALGVNALGWDWFGLKFDDGRDLMVGQIRLADGGREPAFGGLLVGVDGSTEYLPASSFTITALDTWTSPHTGAVYPSGWQITVTPAEGDPFTFSATPMMRDQELHSGDIAYWEGAVVLAGDVTGYGYAELTGYVQAMTGRF
ncbi:MAG: carotenoid 1,2-hydratase [Anaerolineae bacterium]|jgi:predicted secreted hydrolase|nr:carotenoid 1,2-hydratase [Anaerolineae bacterium]